MSGALDASQQIALPVILKHWLEGDDLMKKHFVAVSYLKNHHKSGGVCLDCRWPKPKPPQGAPPWAPFGVEVALIHDSAVEIVFGSAAIYKFQAIHPMFFQKLRGYLYDAHNRHHQRCKEYLR